jgi:hypothetical protein
MHHKTTEATFWRKYTPEPNTGCWLWTGDTYSDGRPRISMNGKRWIASRLAYTFLYGPIPDGLCVCHTCDNGEIGCINPDHLWLGSHQENMDDREKKGRNGTFSKPHRRPRGTKHGGSKLNEKQLAGIRCDLKLGLSYTEIGAKYGINGQIPYRIDKSISYKEPQ